MMNTKIYKPKKINELEMGWDVYYLKNAIQEYSSYVKIKFFKNSYKEKVKQIINEEFKLKREGYYLSLSFINQNCNLCKKCVRPLFCNNALSRPNWKNFPELIEKYNLKKGEGIILIAPSNPDLLTKKIATKRLDFFDWAEKKFDIKLYLVQSKHLLIKWNIVTQCMYGCKNFSRFSRRYCCPPFSLNPNETKKIRKKFKHVLIINKTTNTPFINSSWIGFNPIRDINQKIWCGIHFKEINKIGYSIEKILKRKKFNFYAFGTVCHSCIKCTCPEKCRKPLKLRFVPEACGIDIYEIANKIGIPIEIPPIRRADLFQFIFFNEF